MSADELNPSRVMKIGQAADMFEQPASSPSGATFAENMPPYYAEIAWRFGAAALLAHDDDRGTRTAFRTDRPCLEEERAHAALAAKSYGEAARLFEPLAQRGSHWAQATLGWMHLYGHLGQPDIAKALAWLEKAAVPGYGDAKLFLGLALLTTGDRDRAESVFREGAAENHAGCTSELMFLEETRAWEALDAGQYEEAARRLELLVAQGSTYAMVELGRLHERGRIGEPDVQKAMALWKQAAQLGSTKAAYAMARSLRRSGDKAQARALFLEGAAQGHKPCTYWAGRMIVRGEGGAADRAKGVALLADAAEKGHVYARRELLRLELNEARTLTGRWRVRGKIALLALSVLRRACSEPDIRHSEDFR